MDASIEARAARITPQEWRVIALAIEGVAPAATCEALGIAPGTLESHKQAIRRKLAIPRGERFEAYVSRHFSEGAVPPEKKEPRTAAASESDRRVRWLLRITLEEMSELATSAGLRAQLLSQTVARMGSDDVAEATREVGELKQVSADLRALMESTVARIRAAGASSG